jgi:uncharacterized protein YecE (DUF72 family)
VPDANQHDLFGRLIQSGQPGKPGEQSAPGAPSKPGPPGVPSRHPTLPDGLPLARRKPGRIRVGTSGYSFDDWVGPFYPPGTRRTDMLDFYQQFFTTVEINATYYRTPPPASMQRMVERTPPEFDFMIKLPGALTHQRERERKPVAEFLDSIAPIVRSGKFAGALAQFPYAFHRSTASETYLGWIRHALPDIPLFVEFRHQSWDTDDLGNVLRELGVGFCSVDEPALPGLIPRRALVAGDVAYARFHGRNTATWWTGGGARYDYRYSRSELAEWAEVLESMAARAARTYVFFNNCHAGHAVINAKMMEDLLGLDFAE